MSFTDVDVNAQNFAEIELNSKHVLITSSLGRTATLGEIIYQGGYFGDVTDQDGIADTETGRINIDADRVIRTEQVEATDTFTAGNTLYLEPGGSSAAGTLVDAATGTTVAIGIITGEEGTAGAQTAVEFRPFLQKVNNANLDTRMTAAESDIAVEQAEPKILIVEVATDYGTAAVAVVGLALGDKVIGMHSICNVSETAGTIQLLDGADAAISDALQQATIKEVAYASTIDPAKSTLPASGAKLIATGTDETAVRCTVVITYIPA